MSGTALLVGSSFSAIPLFFALKRRGLRVEVCGNLPGDPCHQYADASHAIDYSDREALLAVARGGRFDYLVPSCNDYAYLASTWVAAQLGFPGFDPVDMAMMMHTKHRFRAFAEAAGIRVPASLRLAPGGVPELGRLRAPYLVKPVDSFSGRGVTRVERAADLAAAIDRARAASRDATVVIENFVPGRLHSHSAFIAGQRVVADFFVDEFCTVYPYQVDCSNHPSALVDGLRGRVRAEIERLAAAAGLADGLVHTQFIADGDDFWIVECMRRCPGDLYNRLIEISTGVPYTDLYVRPFVGEALTPEPACATPRFIGRHTISRAAECVALSWSHRLGETPLDIVPLKLSGERLSAAPFDKLAIFFAEFSSAKCLHETVPRFADLVTIHTPDDLP